MLKLINENKSQMEKVGAGANDAYIGGGRAELRRTLTTACNIL